MAILEREEADKGEGCREEGEFVELGNVSGDTHGSWGFFWDGGINRQP